MDWPLLDCLDPGKRAAVVGAAHRRTFARGEVVFHEGDPADSVHLVVTGHLAVRVSTADGATATLNLLGPGETFGELSLLGQPDAPNRSATVVCLDPVETRAIAGSAFRALCEASPGAEAWVAGLLARRVRDLSDRVRDLMFVGLDRRLYSCLLALAERYDDGDDAAVVPLTQEHLAQFVGSTRGSVNEVLQRLAAQRIVEIGRGRITVLDRAALRRKSGAGG